MRRAWVIAFLCASICVFQAAHGASDGFQEIDTAEDLARTVGYDRLSKFLVATCDNTQNPNDRINGQMLGETIGELIMNGVAFEYMGKDLVRGDVHLRDTLMGLFSNFNFPADQAKVFVKHWAEAGANETVRKTLEGAARRPSALRLLSRYSTESSESWTRTLQGMGDIFDGKSPISIQLMADTVVRIQAVSDQVAKKAIEDIKTGSVESRWVLALGMVNVIQRNGALARFLAKSKPPERSWNLEVWRRFMQKVSNDPLIRDEYIRRIAHAAPLYEEIRAVLEDALSKEGDSFLKGYLQGSIIPKSRFEWVKNALKKTRSELRDLAPIHYDDKSMRALVGEELVKKCKKSEKWANYLLWHLTRTAEAVVLTTRGALASGLNNNEKAVRDIVKDIEFCDPAFQKMIWEAGGFNYYKGGEAEFHQKIESGKVERPALLHYGAAVGYVLATSDEAWGALNESTADRPQHVLRVMLGAAMEADPNTILAWLGTMRNNDFFLRERFVKFLIGKGRTKTEAIFNKWIESVGAAIQNNDVVGNVDVANFRMWFIEFLDTDEGWKAVHQRMKLESSQVPFRLREAMGKILLQEQGRFWRIYGMLVSANGPSVSTLVPKLEHFASASRLPQFLLEEIRLRNIAAADAIDPVWAVMLAPDAPTAERIIQTIVDGSVLSDIYQISATAFIETLSVPRIWRRVKVRACNHLKMKEDAPDKDVQAALFDQLRVAGNKAIPFIRNTMADKSVFDAWRVRLLNSVRFLGKAHIMADFLLSQPDLQKQWITAVSKVIALEPGIMKVVLEALVSRRIGDVTWDKEMTKLRQQVIDIVLGDRVLFEQLIAGKNMDFRVAFEKRLREKTGFSINVKGN
ncbi:MAG: hypothetical protein V1746_01550 [bacterium]